MNKIVKSCYFCFALAFVCLLVIERLLVIELVPTIHLCGTVRHLQEYKWMSQSVLVFILLARPCLRWHRQERKSWILILVYLCSSFTLFHSPKPSLLPSCVLNISYPFFTLNKMKDYGGLLYSPFILFSSSVTSQFLFSILPTF